MPDQQDARLGQRVGEYRLMSKLGGGAFGTVYLAEQASEQTKVAVKVLNIQLTKPEDVKDFINEARTIRLRHPHIVLLFDFGISRDDLPFLVMEYAPEGDLRDRHPKGERLPLSTVISYVDQLAPALQYAHDHRVIHQDIKPANILIRADGTLLVSDFGLAKLLEQSVLLSRQTPVGTPVYMAPEQFNGYPCFASDQYALAVVVYELICGVRPFQGPAIGLAIQHINIPPPSLRVHVPELSEAVDQAVLKALAKAPEDRFECIQKFADALREAVQPSPSVGVLGSLIPSEPQRQTESDTQESHSQAMQPSSSMIALNTPPGKAINVAPPQPLRRRWYRSMVLLLATCFVLVGGSISWFIFLKPTPNVLPTDGIGVTSVDGEDIGISDGRYTLDTDPAWVNKDAIALKRQASDSLRNGHPTQAIAQWNQVHEKDTKDAEPLIYIENQQVLASGNPYITVVLGVALGVNVNDGFSRDMLQGAYVLQKECNQNPQLFGEKKLRLLIARSGSNWDNSQAVARQVVQAAQFDKTIVGVLGWNNSATTLKAVNILADAHLPVVTSNATTDKLTGISPYFFRTPVPNKLQVHLITTYIEKQLKSQKLVIFKDTNETYSHTMSDDLKQQFNADGYSIASIEDFTTDKDAKNGQLAQHVQRVLATYNPDLIFLVTNTVGDIKTLLEAIPASNTNLKVFSGGAGYELVQSDQKPNGYARLLFSVSAYPDVWQIAGLGLGSKEPLPFFTDYIAAYDPHNQHETSPYGYRRANYIVMLTYDALYAILVGSKIASQQGKGNPTPEDIKNALSQIHGSQSFQGISGVISFGPNGDSVDKTHIVIHVVEDPHDHGLYNHVAAYDGCFLASSECNNAITILE